jgi:hypothetical protein
VVEMRNGSLLLACTAIYSLIVEEEYGKKIRKIKIWQG